MESAHCPVNEQTRGQYPNRTSLKLSNYARILLMLSLEPCCSLCSAEWLVLCNGSHECWGPGLLSEPAKDIGNDTIPLLGYIMAKLA